MVSRIKPYNPRASDLVAGWQVVDAAGQVLGRLSTEIARHLTGKNKPSYVAHLLSGDFVVVINAEKIRVTGDKAGQKRYLRHTGYPGHQRSTPYATMLERHPDRVIRHAVKGMLPKTKLGARMLSRLKVYAGPDHPHEAQVRGAENARAQSSGDA